MTVLRFLSQLKALGVRWSPLPPEHYRVVQHISSGGQITPIAQDGALFAGDLCCWNFLYGFLVQKEEDGRYLLLDPKAPFLLREFCVDALSESMDGKTLRQHMLELSPTEFINRVRELAPEDAAVAALWKGGVRRAAERTRHLNEAPNPS